MKKKISKVNIIKNKIEQLQVENERYKKLIDDVYDYCDWHEGCDGEETREVIREMIEEIIRAIER